MCAGRVGKAAHLCLSPPPPPLNPEFLEEDKH
jgi:hypothetical protein